MSKAEWRDEYRFGRASMKQSEIKVNQLLEQLGEQFPSKQPKKIVDDINHLQDVAKLTLGHASNCQLSETVRDFKWLVTDERFFRDAVDYAEKRGLVTTGEANEVMRLSNEVILEVANAVVDTLVVECNCKKR